MKRIHLPFCPSLFPFNCAARVAVIAALWLSLLSVASIAAQQTTADIRTLEKASPIERELRGGESHTYQFPLSVGQFIRLTVEQKNLDVTLLVFDPEGKKIAQADNPAVILSYETLAFIAETDGAFRLEIKPVDEKAATGRYVVKIEEQRAASASDRLCADAERLVMEGDKIYLDKTIEASRRAVTKYQEAVQLFERGGDFRMQARTLKTIGLLAEFTGDRQIALNTYTQLLPIASYLQDKQEPANTVYALGRVQRTLYNYQKALDYYHQAVPLFHASGNYAKECEALNAISFALTEMGESQQALNYLHQALQFARAHQLRVAEMQSLINLGGIYLTLDAPQIALDYFTQCLTLTDALKRRLEPPVLYNNLGRIYTDLGDYAKALENLNKALPLRREMGDVIGEAAAISNIGRVYFLQGDIQKAMSTFQESLALYREGSFLRGEAIVLTHLGRCYQALGDLEKAEDFYNQALKLRRAIADKSGEAIALYNLSTLENRDPQVAMDNIAAAIRLVESQRTKVDVQELRASYLASFQRYYEHYIDLLMQSGGGRPEQIAAALQISERARARTLLDSLSEAQANIRQGADAALLNRERELKQLLNIKSASFLRLTSNKRTAVQAEAVKKDVDALTTELQYIEGQIRQASPHYAALMQPQPLTLAEIQRQVVDEESLLLEYALGEKRSYLWAITPTGIRAYTLPKRAEIDAAARRFYDLLSARSQVKRFETVSEKQLRLKKAAAELPQAAAALSQMILAPVAGELQTKRLLIVSDGALQYIPFAALPLPGQSKTATLQLGVTNEIVNLPSASTLAVLRQELHNRQPAPKTVAVFADPIFDTQDERFALAKAQQKTAPAIVAQSRNRSNTRAAAASINPAPTTAPATQNAADKSGRSLAPAVAASTQASVMESDLTRAAREAGFDTEELLLPRIPFTRQEANAIRALVPAAQQKTAMDFAANKRAALDAELSQYRYVHFATHGFLNTAHPELSGLALSMIDEDGKEQDGFLRAHEIYNLKLPVELVVLSGCRTGLGKEIRGEGLIGMTRGFMYAGAARVLVSLWDVSDEVTAEFMSRFYRAMLGKERLSPAAALRAARASMARDQRWSAPYYWAAFVLQGEPK